MKVEKISANYNQKFYLTLFPINILSLLEIFHIMEVLLNIMEVFMVTLNV